MTQQPGITASVHLPGSLVTAVPPNDKHPQELLAPPPLPAPSYDAPSQPTPPRILVPVPSPALPEHTSSFELSGSG
ncbi:hypothetical protein K4H02_26465, partial [Mycobacterium tuberculosis]|nr:hypothetical protein [Mycobacterium tuberculosis]